MQIKFFATVKLSVQSAMSKKLNKISISRLGAIVSCASSRRNVADQSIKAPNKTVQFIEGETAAFSFSPSFKLTSLASEATMNIE